MDSISSDCLTRLFGIAPSRRTLGGVLLGLGATLTSLLDPGKTAAHNPLPACRSIPDQQRRRRCLRRARRHIRRNHCPRGFANCDGKRSNRCETNLRNNVNHCGGCGIVCTGPEQTTASCRKGQCTIEMHVEDGGDRFTTLEAGEITIEVLGAAGGRGGRGGAAFFGGGSGGPGGNGGRGGKVTATFRVAAGESFFLRAGRAGGDGGDASGDIRGDGADTASAGSDGDNGIDGTGGSGGGGGGGCGGGEASVDRNNTKIIIAGGGGGGGGGGGAGLGGTGDGVPPGGAGGDGGNGQGIGIRGAGGDAGAGGVPGSGSGQPGEDGSPGQGSVSEIAGTIVPGANPGPARIKVTFTAAKPRR